MSLKHIHIALNFIALVAINVFIVMPVLRFTLFRNDPYGIHVVVALLLSLAYLTLYQIEMQKKES